MAIFLSFLPYLFQAAAAVPQIWDYIQKTRESLRQKGEWTQAAEDAYTLELENLKANPPDWWKSETSA